MTLQTLLVASALLLAVVPDARAQLLRTVDGRGWTPSDLHREKVQERLYVPSVGCTQRDNVARAHVAFLGQIPLPPRESLVTS